MSYMRVILFFSFCFLSSLNTYSQAEFTQISRLPALKAPLDEPTQKLLDATRSKGGQIINLHLTYAHAPSIGQANLSMAYALRFQSKSPRQLREIAIIRTAQILDAKYELNQHYSLGLACGLSAAQIDGMPNWRGHAEMFNQHQQAVLAYAEAIGYNKGEVDDATFSDMTHLFDSQEIVELTMAISAYTSTAYFTKALRTQVEVDGRSAAPGQC